MSKRKKETTTLKWARKLKKFGNRVWFAPFSDSLASIIIIKTEVIMIRVTILQILWLKCALASEFRGFINDTYELYGNYCY